MNQFKKDLQLISDLQSLIDEAGRTVNMPGYAGDVIGSISPVLSKVMPAAKARAKHQVDVLTRAKDRLSELMEEVHKK